MYDIEGKYKNLMTIAGGRCTCKFGLGKEEKYKCIGSEFWDAYVIIKNCKEDEREMLRIWISRKKNSAEQSKAVLDLINVALVILALVLSACSFVIEGSKVVIPQESSLSIFEMICLSSFLYIVIYTWRCIKRTRIIVKTTFLLDLIESYASIKKYE